MRREQRQPGRSERFERGTAKGGPTSRASRARGKGRIRGRESESAGQSQWALEQPEKNAYLEELVGHPARDVPVVQREVEELVPDRESLVVGVCTKAVGFVVCEHKISPRHKQKRRFQLTGECGATLIVQADPVRLRSLVE